MAWPFSAPLEVRELFHNLPLLAVLVVLLLAGAFAAFTLVARKRLLFTTGWIFVSMGPTAIFGFYNDRYLSLPFMGAAMLLGFIAEGLIERARHRSLTRAAVALALCLYTAVSIARLAHYERSWAAAGQEIRATMDATRRLHPHVPDGTVFTFVNLTHSREKGQIYIFNVGLNGTLWASGYDTSVTGRRTFASGDPLEERLMKKLLSCEKDTGTPGSDRYTLVVAERVQDVSGECARTAVGVSQKEEPELWR